MSAADHVVTDEAVLYQTTETGVAVVTFNRPERLNAWGPDISSGFYACIDRAEADPAVRVIVLTGAGRGSARAPTWAARDPSMRSWATATPTSPRWSAIAIPTS